MKIDKILILLFIFCLPYNNFPYGVGGTLTPLALIPLSLIIILNVLTFFIKRNKTLKINKYILTLSLIFFIFLLITIFNDLFYFNYFIQNKHLSPFLRTFQFVIYIYISIGSFFVGYIALRYYQDIDKILKLILIAYLPSLIFGFLEILLNNNHVLNAIRSFLASTKFPDGYYRIYMLTTEPSWAAFDLTTFIIPLSFYFYLKKNQVRYILLIIFSLILLIFTKSLLGFIIFIISFLIILFLYFKNFLKRTKYLLSIIFIIIIFINGIFIFKDMYIERFDKFISGNDSSAITRTITYNVALEIFENHPVIGVGFRNSGYFYKDIIYSLYPEVTNINLISDWSDPYSKRFPTIKSGILEIVSSAGLIGFIILLIFLWNIAKYIKQTKDKNIKVLYAYIIISSLTGSFSMDLIGYPVFWFFVGLLFSMKNMIKLY